MGAKIALGIFGIFRPKSFETFLAEMWGFGAVELRSAAQRDSLFPRPAMVVLPFDFQKHIVGVLIFPDADFLTVETAVVMGEIHRTVFCVKVDGVIGADTFPVCLLHPEKLFHLVQKQGKELDGCDVFAIGPVHQLDRIHFIQVYGLELVEKGRKVFVHALGIYLCEDSNKL